MGAAYLPKVSFEKYVKVENRKENWAMKKLPEEQKPSSHAYFRPCKHQRGRMRKVLSAFAVTRMLKRLEGE